MTRVLPGAKRVATHCGWQFWNASELSSTGSRRPATSLASARTVCARRSRSGSGSSLRCFMCRKRAMSWWATGARPACG